jgi:hypothetical protein
MIVFVLLIANRVVRGRPQCARLRLLARGRSGIGGFRLAGLWRYKTYELDVGNGLRHYAAVIVELNLGTGYGFAHYIMPAASHDAVVDGFTSDGPLRREPAR